MNWSALGKVDELPSTDESAAKADLYRFLAGETFVFVTMTARYVSATTPFTLTRIHSGRASLCGLMNASTAGHLLPTKRPGLHDDSPPHGILQAARYSPS